MTRTQHWSMALLLTTTLLSSAIIFTLMNRPSTPAIAAMQDAPMAASSNSVSDQPSTNSMSEPVALKKASQLLPSQKIEAIKKVNYEGTLAYEVTTAEQLLYLDAATGAVLVVAPHTAAKPDIVQVSYASGQHEHDEYHDEGEHDDD